MECHLFFDHPTYRKKVLKQITKLTEKKSVLWGTPPMGKKLIDIPTLPDNLYWNIPIRFEPV